MICSSLAEALETGSNTFHSGRTCANGHTDVVEYINSRNPVKYRCHECLKIAGAKKKAKARQDPVKRAIINERVKNINRDRYANDPGYRKYFADSRLKWEAGKKVEDVAGKTAHYLAKAIEVHGDKYDYSKFEYTNTRFPITIICKIHGEFKQTKRAHIDEKRDCPECMKSFSVSKSENRVADFVESLGVKVVRGSRSVIPPYELDIYCPEHNVAIEYCGLRWHSTQMAKSGDYSSILESNRKMKNKHYSKYAECEKAGIKLITMFEDEWLNSRGAVEKTIRNIFGKCEKVCYARQLDISVCDFREVKDFFNLNHMQGSPQSGLVVVGKFDGNVVCAMAFSKAYSERGENDGSWELARFCSSGSVPGGASRLFKHFMKVYSPVRVISYSDNRWFNGKMYETLGFSNVSVTPPDYYVIRQQNRWHKTAFKRKYIPNKIKEFGLDIEFNPDSDPRSELHITALMGCGRIYDCGKKKWVLVASPLPC